MKYEEWIEEHPLRKWIDEKETRTQGMVAAFCGVHAYTVYCWLAGSQRPNRHWDRLALMMKNPKIQQEWMAWYDKMDDGEVEID